MARGLAWRGLARVLMPGIKKRAAGALRPGFFGALGGRQAGPGAKRAARTDFPGSPGPGIVPSS